jgi:DNA-binding response OmpR family regulator
MSHVCLVITPQGDANLRADLDLCGIRLKQVNSFAAAHGLMTHRRFDAMVLVVDAVDSLTLRHIRSATTDTAPPLLVIARDDDDEAQIRALDSGAAGWLSGPVSLRLVACKVRSLIGAVERHERKDPGGTLRFGSTPIDRRLAAAQVHGAPLELTAAQFNVLALLAERAGGHVQREELDSRCAHVPKPGRGADRLTCRLRRLLREAGALDVELIMSGDTMN